MLPTHAFMPPSPPPPEETFQEFAPMPHIPFCNLCITRAEGGWLGCHLTLISKHPLGALRAPHLDGVMKDAGNKQDL